MTDDELLDVLAEAAAAVAEALGATSDWGETGDVPGQHHSDLAADAAAMTVLQGAGLTVFSEESGWTDRGPEPGSHDQATEGEGTVGEGAKDQGAKDQGVDARRADDGWSDGRLTVVIDPLDGSTNAKRGISWWATSLCVVDGEGPRVALVDDLVHGTRTTAVRGHGAHVDGRAVQATGCTELHRAIVGLNGLPARHLGWAQCRALGAAALDLCAVATGRLDGFLDCSGDGLAPWDYLGAVLVCQEAGAVVRGLDDRALHDLSTPVRRSIVAGATEALVDDLAHRFAAVGPLRPWRGVGAEDP